MDINFDDIVGLLAQIAGWFESVAPAVWEIMLKKTLADTVVNLATGSVSVFGFIFTFWLIRYGIKNWEDIEENGLEAAYVLAIILVIVFSSVFVAGLFTGIKMLIAPEYYTIRSIFEFVK